MRELVLKYADVIWSIKIVLSINLLRLRANEFESLLEKFLIKNVIAFKKLYTE